MANNARTKISAKVEAAVKNIENATRNAGAIAFAAGDSFTFNRTNDNLVQNISGTVPYSVLVANDGTPVPVSQIVRRRNGLSMNGNTMSERLLDWLNSWADDTITITIASVRTRNGIGNDGRPFAQQQIVWQ